MMSDRQLKKLENRYFVNYWFKQWDGLLLVCLIGGILFLTFCDIVAIGCGGTTVVEKTVTKTVTASPSPTPTPVFSETESDGIAMIESLLPDLEHIFSTSVKAENYGARTGDLMGTINKLSHALDDYEKFTETYNNSNGGEFYGGKVAHLEGLFEDAASHVKKFIGGLIRILDTPGNLDSAALNAGTQQYRAETGIEDVKEELEKLTGLQTISY
jgi:hypothetical protein